LPPVESVLALRCGFPDAAVRRLGSKIRGRLSLMRDKAAAAIFIEKACNGSFGGDI
jgi:hypothetical protein